MKNLNSKYLTGILFVVFLAGSFWLGNVYGQKNVIQPEQYPNVSVINNDVASSTSGIDMEPFWKVWSVLNKKFVSTHKQVATTTDQDRVWGAIQGMTAALGDPYTVFMPPVEAKAFETDLSGNFEGVGMEIGIKNGVLTVISPLKGSPAEKAGMKAGDKIVMIDGTPSADFSTEKAVKLIRGPKGTKVKLTILRGDSAKTMEVEITRDVVNVPTVDTEIKGDVFVIKLYNFYANSSSAFREAIKEFANSGKVRLVLDLRGNPGGYLDAAVDMASFFLPAGKTIVKEDFGTKADPVIYQSKGYDVFNENLKFVILVDGGSASASEILAGALQEQGKAKLVGVKTFGKGSVQELIPITKDTNLKVTIAKWLTPKGNSISESGLTPDFQVKMTDKDLKDGTDPQMAKAIELLK
ncbi:MAG: S41 family peptidase [bacterium]